MQHLKLWITQFRLRNVIGLQDHALQWFKSYLECRPQYVRVGDAASIPVQLDFSVPQGSVLGPQLFSLYIFPLKEIIHSYVLQYHTYAYYLQLYVSFSPSEQHAETGMARIEACIREIRQWMNNNFLKINDNETEFMLIGSPQQSLYSVYYCRWLSNPAGQPRP